MALVLKGYEGEVRVYDASGKNNAPLKFSLNAANVSDAEANMADIVADLDALTDGKIGSWFVKKSFISDDGLEGATGSQVENIASISCGLETGNKKHTLKIPAPVSDVFQSTTGEQVNIVDVAYAPLRTYVQNFVDTTTYDTPLADDALAFVSDGEKIKKSPTGDFPDIQAGKRTHKRSSNG